MNTPKMSTRISGISIGAVILYHLLMTATIFLRPDLDPYWHTISEYAVGSFGWIMVAAFISSSVAYASLFINLKSQVKGVMGFIGLGVLLICAISVFSVGIFITDPLTTPPDQLTTRGIIHMISGSLQLMLLPFAALIININLVHRNPEWFAMRKPLLWTACIPLIGLIGFIFHFIVYVAPLGENAYGPEVSIGWPPRILFISYLIWVITIALQMIKIESGRN